MVVAVQCVSMVFGLISILEATRLTNTMKVRVLFCITSLAFVGLAVVLTGVFNA